MQCRACGTPVEIGEPIPRDSECTSCRRDLRCCANCRHYDARYNNSCRENQADPVEDKERRNFCEYFTFNREPFVAAGKSSSREAEARTRLNALFGGAPAPDRQADARRKLDALFGKPGDRTQGSPEDS
jgi:hypothetical protein